MTETDGTDGDPSDLEWRLIGESSCDGPTSMAFDEVAAETVAAGGPATVRVYRWTPSTLSLGYRQDPETVDWAFCENRGLSVTRRPTGGGGIYHDTFGDVAYSVIAPADPFPEGVTDCYRLFLEPVLEAFERVGLEVGFAEQSREALYPPACYLLALDPVHDLVCDGRKIAGNAQYRTREAVVQHGSLTFAVDAETHLGCFADPPVDARTFEKRVCGVSEFVDADRADFVAELEGALAEWSGADRGAWTDTERDRAAEIAEAKYRSDEWVRGRRDPLA